MSHFYFALRVIEEDLGSFSTRQNLSAGLKVTN
jgi:hypothetical protein